MRPTLLLFSVAIAVCLASLPRANAAEARLPENARTVLFLGDSITHAGWYVNDIETYFVTRRLAPGVAFINAGVSSETVSGLSEEGHANGQFPRPDLRTRLSRTLELIKPDLVFACYGMNDGIYLPFDEERFTRFRDGTERLHATVEKSGARIIHLTPPIYDEARGHKAGYATVLDRYSAWLLAQRQRGWQVLDVHAALQQATEQHRQTDAAFTFNKDGVHPDQAGHWVMARAVLQGLGADSLNAYADARAMAMARPRGEEIAALVAQRQGIVKFAWLSAVGHTRPGIKPGLPLPEAKAKTDALDAQIAALLKPAP
jgi:lysophospholipase L1-like esterase